MPGDPRVAIIGAGPTGLGAAWRLHESGHSDWALFESADHAGGLASSVTDAQGFTWDMGGHVLFSHYRYFDDVMVAALGDRWVDHVREAWVWMRQCWIPYPLQNNIWRLPPKELEACLDGLRQRSPRVTGSGDGATFREWLLERFGQGLCDAFMFPYNRKVWGFEPSALGVGWMGERVATVDLDRVMANVAARRDDCGWGPNSTFRFPLHGGTGAIWHALSARLPAARQHFSRAVVGIDVARRRLRFADGTEHGYDHLISTMPLDMLLRMIGGQTGASRLAGSFVHSSTHIVGIGLRGQPPADLRTKCWIYFPEPQQPFYRATVFSNYSPHNVSRPGEQWSLMAEVSETVARPVDGARVVDDVIDAMVACGFVARTAIVSRWHRRLEHGYPTPWLGRDAILAEADAALQGIAILSRGRFGAWKYEVSNQDHSFMQGVEAVDRILCGAGEPTYAARDDGSP